MVLVGENNAKPQFMKHRYHIVVNFILKKKYAVIRFMQREDPQTGIKCRNINISRVLKRLSTL